MSSTEKEAIKRYSKSSLKPQTIRLDQIETDANSYCHRGEEKLSAKKLEQLAESLAKEGQQTPLIVVKSAKGKFKLVGGYRRFHALKQAAKNNYVNCSEDMEVTANVMVPGEGQSEEEFEQDVLVRSFSDNEYRVKFDDSEKLRGAKLLIDKDVDAKRAMSALGVKESQYRRYVLIVNEPWLYEAVDSGEIKSTNAAKLIEAAKKQDEAKDRTEVTNPEVVRLKLLRRGFEKWLVYANAELEKANEWRAANKKKPLEGKQAHLSRFFANKTMAIWDQCLEDGIEFDEIDQSQFAFLVNVDLNNMTLEIPKVSLKSDEISELTLEKVIGGMEDGVNLVSKLLVKVLRTKPVSDEESRQALAVVRAKRSGVEPKPEPEAVPPLRNVSEEIQNTRNATSSFDEGSSTDEIQEEEN